MAYKIPIKKKEQKTKYSYDEDKIKFHKKINNLLFNKTENKNPKLLTIIVRKDKEHHFHFLRNETEFEVQGKWRNNKHKLYSEENSEITVQYFDDDNNTKTKELKKYLEDYNKKYVKEEVLYTTTTPLEMTSLTNK
jgi:hypothetical protein